MVNDKQKLTIQRLEDNPGVQTTKCNLGTIDLPVLHTAKLQLIEIGNVYKLTTWHNFIFTHHDYQKYFFMVKLKSSQGISNNTLINGIISQEKANPKMVVCVHLNLEAFNRFTFL